MTFIFTEPRKAMELFVQRMFEERIKPAVERCGLGNTLDHFRVGGPLPGALP